jgi:light-regulated signal transduction histidine kinase (bacteriophytochrome)
MNEREAHPLEELRDLRKDFQGFCHRVSSDLQGSLRNIGGFTSLIEERSAGSFDEKSKTYLNFIKENTEKAQVMLDGLMDYSCLFAEGKNFSTISLETPFKTVMKELAEPIQKKQAIIHEKLCPVIIFGNEELLKRAFKCVLENALMYAKSIPRINITFEKKTAQYVITIHDHGIGIPQEYHKSVFEPFERLHPYHQYPGIGLGLSIAKRIIEAHHGRIWIESPGHGTSVMWALPLRA